MKSKQEFFKDNLGDSHKGEVEFIATMVKEDNILDVGCGKGNLEVLLEKKGFKNISALDFSEKSLDEVKSRTKKTTVFLHDLTERLPFKDNQFNLVLCCEVLEHIDNPMFVIKECMRVGKEVIIAVPNGFWQEMIPRDWTLTSPNYYAPTKKFFNSAIHWLDGEVIEWKYYYSYDFKLNFLRKFFPRFLSTSFIVRIKKYDKEKVVF